MAQTLHEKWNDPNEEKPPYDSDLRTMIVLHRDSVKGESRFITTRREKDMEIFLLKIEQ
jgi:hypothetical protein